MIIEIIETLIAVIIATGILAVLLYPAVSSGLKAKGLDWNGNKLP